MIYRRLRYYKPAENPFSGYIISSIDTDSVDALEGRLVNNVTQEKYVFKIYFLEYSTIRITIREEKVYRQRFQPNVALLREPSLHK